MAPVPVAPDHGVVWVLMGFRVDRGLQLVPRQVLHEALQQDDLLARHFAWLRAPAGPVPVTPGVQTE